MSVLDEDFTLPNGNGIPKIGFGTWQIPAGEAAYAATASALCQGYRHIDTARAYGNEADVGRAIRDAGIDRSRVFVTSKLPAEIKSYEGAWQSYRETMAALDLEYLDLYLIHAPWPWDRMGMDCRRENVLVWKAMEEILESGRCRAIGVSNFAIPDLEVVLAHCRIKPMANQIRFFVGHAQAELTGFCQHQEILVEGYSPLATGALLNDASLAAMARRYQASVAQLCVRYVLQKGVLPLPKSTHPEFIRQNAQVDFILSEDDMRSLDARKSTA